MRSDPNYTSKRAVVKPAAREKFLVATFLLGSDRRQYRGVMTQLSNDSSKGQKIYPSTVQNLQALLMAW